MVGPYAHDEEDKAARFRDGDRNTTSVCQEGRKATRANEYDGDADSVPRASLFMVAVARPGTCDDMGEVARPCAYDGEDDAVPFRQRNISAKNDLRDCP